MQTLDDRSAGELAALVARGAAALASVGVAGARELEGVLGSSALRAQLERAWRQLATFAEPRGTVVPLGSDEVVVVIARGGSDPVLFARQLVDAVALSSYNGPTPVPLRLTAGVAAVEPGLSAEDVLVHARLAQARTAMAGSDSVVEFSPELVERARYELRIAGDLRMAVSGKHDLRLDYQPIVDVPSGGVIGLEGLLRWRHPVYGELPADEVVRLAESRGMVGDLDRWVLTQACTDIGALERQHALPPGLRVGVNVSAVTVAETAFARDVQAALARRGVRPDRLLLEVSAAPMSVDAVQRARANAEALRTTGVHIALDDFGSGYSFLDRVRRMPLDVVKIDRSFAADIATSREAWLLLQSMVDIARAMSLTTVVEGVESPDQAVELQRMGVSCAQGWLWSPALSVTDVASLLTSRASAPGGAAPARRRREAVKRVTINNGLAEIARLAEQGCSPATIAAALNQKGFRTPDGTRWHRAIVSQVLSDLPSGPAPAAAS